MDIKTIVAAVLTISAIPTLGIIFLHYVTKRVRRKRDGVLFIDLLCDDAPLDMRLDIGIGELLQKDTITLKVIDVNKGLKDIQEDNA